jgi:hypothetical protein
MFDFLRILIRFFDSNQIPYMLSGSVAMSLYVEPRFTRDYDFVVHLRDKNIDDLLEYFKEGYYCSEEAVRDAMKRKSMFNIIDQKSGYKADFVILKNELFRQTEFERRQQLKFLEMNINIVSREDLLLSKIIWIQEIQSGVQMEDIKLLSQLEELDWKYINSWVKELHLKTFNLLPN